MKMGMNQKSNGRMQSAQQPKLQDSTAIMKKMPWERGEAVPSGYWMHSMENRVTAINWLLQKTNKKQEELSQDDFSNHHLTGILNQYNGSVYAALNENGMLPDGFRPWQMKNGVPQGYWHSKENRVEAVKWLVQMLGKNPEELCIADFLDNGLRGPIKCNGGPYKALKEAGVLPEGFMPWQMKKTPQSFWHSKENRIEAVKWLLEKTGKTGENITGRDFRANNLRGPIKHHGGSPYLALKEAGVLPEGFMPWQMVGGSPQGYWKSKENRTLAVKWLMDKTGKRYYEIIGEDFEKQGLYGCIAFSKYSPYEVLKDAGVLPEGFRPWQMKKGAPQRYWKSKENRVEAMKWLLEKTGKKPWEISQVDFNKNKLSGLLNPYGGSPYQAMKEAGVLPEGFRPWQMDMAPIRYWQSKENRIAAVKWLVQRLSKELGEINISDFSSHGLAGLLMGYYHGSPYRALIDAGFDVTNKSFNQRAKEAIEKVLREYSTAE